MTTHSKSSDAIARRRYDAFARRHARERVATVEMGPTRARRGVRRLGGALDGDADRRARWGDDAADVGGG